MANKTVYPYGTGGSLPASIGIINDLTTGGVDKALSAEMGVYIKGVLDGNSSEVAIDLSTFERFGYFLASDGRWGINDGNSWLGKCLMIPLSSISKVSVEADGGNGNIAFLKNDTMEVMQQASFCTTYPSVISVVDGDDPVEYDIPSDANFLYILVNGITTGVDYISRYTVKQLIPNSGVVFIDKIADDLTTDNAKRPLSAKQGVGIGNRLSALEKVGGGSLVGKKVSIIGDSISCFGTENEVRAGQYNNPYYKILSVDVGETIESWVTWLDVYRSYDTSTPTGKTIGGITLTQAMIGTKQTFTPVAGDIGKCIGIPGWGVQYPDKPWWQVMIEKTGMVYCANASWSGARVIPVPQGESDHDAFVLSEMYSDYTIGRIKGRADDGTYIVPDIIILYRGTNDFSANDQSGNESIETPDMLSFTGITDAHNFTQGYIWSILKLRETYPDAVIMLCTLNVFKRRNKSHFPSNNGTYTLPDYNNKIREIANIMGCGVIEMDKDGITFENCYPTYISDSATVPTHPNTTGHLVMGTKAANDVKYYLP